MPEKKNIKKYIWHNLLKNISYDNITSVIDENLKLSNIILLWLFNIII